jgi:hypothetical protein
LEFPQFKAIALHPGHYSGKMAMRLLDIEGSRHAKTIFPTAWRLCQDRSIAPGDLGHWTPFFCAK